MDKNMIHIDDLIRQRLNGEEEERAGAWLRMKDLLDKDMPKPAAGIGWRKTLLLSAAIVAAITTVGVAGYQMSSSFRNTAADNSMNAVANPSFAINKATDKIAQQPPVAQPADVATNEAYAAANSSDKALNPTSATHVDARMREADKAKTDANKPNTAKTSNSSIVNNTGNTVTHQPQQTISPANITHAVTPSVSESSIASIKPQPQDQKTAAGDRSENTTAANTVTSTTDTKLVTKVDVAQKMVIDQRTNTATFIDNETGREQIQVQVPVTTTATTTTPEPQPEQKEPVIASAKAAYGPPRDEYHSSVESSVFAKKNTSSGSSVSVWQSVSDYFKNAQYQLGQTKINTGVIGGLNKTFGNYGLLGVNVGLFSDFMFTEQWGARIEAKYMHWFNQGTTYRNDYNTYVQEGNQYTMYKNDHSFKYSTMWNADVPVMIQYRPYKSGVSIFAGANLSYFSGLTPEETKQTSLVANGLTSAPAPAVPMTVSDFNARFGMGAILGVGYNVNDMMQVGFRVSRSFADNAKGDNAQKVSKDLYRTPNVQLNFSYRFGKDKKEN